MKIELLWKVEKTDTKSNVRRFKTVKEAETWYEKNIKGHVALAHVREVDKGKVKTLEV